MTIFSYYIYVCVCMCACIEIYMFHVKHITHGQCDMKFRLQVFYLISDTFWSVEPSLSFILKIVSHTAQ